MNGQGLLVVIDALGIELEQKASQIAQLQLQLNVETKARQEAELALLAEREKKPEAPTP